MTEFQRHAAVPSIQDGCGRVLVTGGAGTGAGTCYTQNKCGNAVLFDDLTRNKRGYKPEQQPAQKRTIRHRSARKVLGPSGKGA
jgi:hypothetical protein